MLRFRGWEPAEREREREGEHRPPTASLRPFKTVVWIGLKYTEANAKGHNSLDGRIERSILGAICQKIDRRTGPDSFPPSKWIIIAGNRGMLLKEHNFKEHRVQANNFHSNILYSLYALYREIIVPFKFKEQLIERDYSYRMATTNLFEKVICVYMYIYIYIILLVFLVIFQRWRQHRLARNIAFRLSSVIFSASHSFHIFLPISSLSNISLYLCFPRESTPWKGKKEKETKVIGISFYRVQ